MQTITVCQTPSLFLTEYYDCMKMHLFTGLMFVKLSDWLIGRLTDTWIPKQIGKVKVIFINCWTVLSNEGLQEELLIATG